MNLPAHKTTAQNHTFFVSVFPSSFTGKERDEETGYGYFGARYMDHELMTMWLSVDPMADKYPGISPYAYCAWNPVIATDPFGMDSVHTPNGMVNVGDGYKATEDGMYLYGYGLQTKKWNPYLEMGGVVGDRGGYENCDDADLTPYGIVLGMMTNVNNLDEAIGVRSDGHFSYTRTKYDKLSHGTARNHVRPIGRSIPGKGLKYGGGTITVLLAAGDMYSNIREYGVESPETYSAIGGAVGTGVSLWVGTYLGAAVGSAFGGIGAVPGAIAGFFVGVGVNLGLDLGGRALGETIYKRTH